MTYTTAQHGNYTDPTLEGRLASGAQYGVDEPGVFGKGIRQNKGGLAATLGALKILVDERIPLRGTLLFVLNTESQSSHRCSIRLLDGHGLRADAGWLAMGVAIAGERADKLSMTIGQRLPMVGPIRQT